MAQDLYGARALLHEGVLPSILVFRHPGYLRGEGIGTMPPLRIPAMIAGNACSGNMVVHFNEQANGTGNSQ